MDINWKEINVFLKKFKIKIPIVINFKAKSVSSVLSDFILMMKKNVQKNLINVKYSTNKNTSVNPVIVVMNLINITSVL